MTNNTAIILLLLSAGIFYTFTDDQYKQVRSLYTLSSSYQDTLDNITQISDLRDSLLGTYNSLPALDIERLEKVLPEDADSVRLALDLDTIAARNNIALSSVDVKASESNSGEIVVEDPNKIYNKVTVAFNFASNYQNFANFLTDLERNLRIMNVKSVDFVTSETGVYDHSVEVETYWLKK